jgi:hypothetical protein
MIKSFIYGLPYYVEDDDIGVNTLIKREDIVLEGKRI